MVGFVAAVFAEIGGGAPVAEQLGIAPLSIGLVFALFTVASLVPILRVCAGPSLVGEAIAMLAYTCCAGLHLLMNPSGIAHSLLPRVAQLQPYVESW